MPITQLDGGQILDGTVDLSADVFNNLPVTNLDSGTNASTATFWRGDGKWSNQINGSLILRASTQAAGTNGQIYFDSSTNRYRGFSTTWSNIVTNDSIDTFTNKTLTAPKLISNIYDINSNILIGTTTNINAVNYLNISNSTSGVDPTLSALGSDTNIDLIISGKGTGYVQSNSVLYVNNVNSSVQPAILSDVIIYAIGDTSSSFKNITAEGYGSNGVGLALRRARGTYSSPSSLQAGDTIGGHSWRGYGTTKFGNIIANIKAVASENFTDTSQGTYISFNTTKNGTNSSFESMRLSNEGSVDMNSTGYLKLPNGMTIDRPSNGTNGMIRYNSQTLRFEAYDNGYWYNMNTYSNVVVVRTLSDFPPPVSGVITLTDNVAYQINGAVSIGTNVINMGVSNLIAGFDKSSDKIVYYGTNAMINCYDQDFSVRLCTLAAVSANSKIFNINSTSGLNIVQIEENIIGNSAKVGTVKGGSIFVFNNNLIKGCADGWDFSGNLEHIFYYQNINHQNTGGTNIKISSGSYGIVDIGNNHFHPLGTEVALDIANTITLQSGILESNSFLGNGTYIKAGTINGGTTNWYFGTTNTGIAGFLRSSIEYGFTVAIGATSTSQVTANNTVIVDNAVNYLPLATTVTGVFSCEASGNSNGSVNGIQIYNMTDDALVGSEVLYTTAVGGTWQIVTGVETVLTQGKTYSFKLRSVSGGGQKVRSAKMALKIY